MSGSSPPSSPERQAGAITAVRVISTSPGSTGNWSAMEPCRARRAIGTNCSRERFV